MVYAASFVVRSLCQYIPALVVFVHVVKKEQRGVTRVLARGREVIQATFSVETDPGAVWISCG